MREPKRAKKAINKLHNIVDTYLAFAYPEMPKELRDDLVFIEETLADLSIEQKVHDIRLATKLKKIWEKNDKLDN